MASATVGKLSLLLSTSPLQVEEETKAMIDQNHLGIVSILRSDHANSNMATANTLRRNLSADMSSRKWLAQNGLSSSSSMKKIASSEQLSSLEDQINSRPGQDDVWMSIQLKNNNNNNNNNKEVEKPDTWESILSQNAKEDNQYPNNIIPPPYVHPLVKRSSSLSDKSLQICTESLGSETGSEEFSSYPSSETTSSDTEDQNKEEQKQQLKQASQMEKQSVVVVVVDSASGQEEWQPTKCMYSTRSTSTRSFPPPLSSLAQSAGPTLHMQSRRLNGRLVLEAVSVPSKNFFQAQRQDGRLVLKLNSNQNQDLSETNVVDDDFEEDEEEVEEIVRQETKVKEVTVLMEQQEPRLLQSVGTKVKEVTVLMEQQEPRLLPCMGTIMFQKIMRIDNVNPAWPNRFNRKINLSRVEMELELDQEEDATAQSLPHVARLIRSPAATTTVGTTGSFNAYDYFWRTKPTNNQQSPTEKNNNKLTNYPHNSPKACERQELVFLRGNKGEYLVPLVTGCKDSRRSLLIWEPYCIATS